MLELILIQEDIFMARRRKLSPERKEFINGLLEHYQPTDAHDVQEMLKDLLGDTLQGMLEAEMDEKLGYSKYDYKNKDTDDSRNGYSPKTVTSSMGPIDLDIPRDRKGEFQPQVVKKNQTDISDIEDQVLSMYAKGMTTRDISAHLRDVYGVEASAEMQTSSTFLHCGKIILPPTPFLSQPLQYPEQSHIHNISMVQVL